MVMSRDYIDDEPVIIRIIRKNNFAVMVIKEFKTDKFKIIDVLINRFQFKKESNKNHEENKESNHLNPAKSRHSKYKKHTRIHLSPNLYANSNNELLPVQSDVFEKASERNKTQIEMGEIGPAIIQRIKTIEPEDEVVSIDYVIFWIANEGLKQIEKTINDILLKEVNVIKDQSRDLGVNSKLEFLQKIDLFQNLFISAQNAKDIKRTFFKKIIESELPSLEFRYLIRHLKSRMTNLHSTTVIIERKLELAKNTFQIGIDANLTNYSRQLDSIMKIFASIATMFLPLQLISGMWGMNVKVPFQDVESVIPFWMIFCTMVIIVASFLMYFRYKKWM